ncbi:MAG: glycine zipper domain-containing protein [Gammaproteobacteria bacterium]|nr:glycine zipper domain-containing protein [Gammaproteobacteria bacterium]
MKHTISRLTIIALMITLTACATNTREQNTVIGAGTGAVAGGLLGSLATGAGAGWVIAAGAIVGGLVGGYVGHSMESSDDVHMTMAMDHNAINQPSHWKNDKTGVWYKIVPTSGVFAYKGSTYCRHYVAYGKYEGKTTKTKGIACRSNEKWQQVR